MNKAASNCQWCGDKPGGCLYCIEQLEDSDPDKLMAIHDMIERGEVHVVAVRNTQQVLVRLVGGMSRRSIAAPLQGPCRHHIWAHDLNNFKRRHCIHAGCPARQRFVWLPTSPDRNGEWVDETAVAALPAKKKSRGIKKTKAVG